MNEANFSLGPSRTDERLSLTGPGAIAQLGERLDRTQEVGGSSPPSSTPRTPASAGVLAFGTPMSGSGFCHSNGENQGRSGKTPVIRAHLVDASAERQT